MIEEEERENRKRAQEIFEKEKILAAKTKAQELKRRKDLEAKEK